MTLKLDSVYVRGSDGEFHLHAKASQEKKSTTHYDLLIRKTPEEMVEWIESIEPAACPWRDDHGDNCRFTHCRDCWLDWLNAEANEM